MCNEIRWAILSLTPVRTSFAEIVWGQACFGKGWFGGKGACQSCMPTPVRTSVLAFNKHVLVGLLAAGAAVSSVM